MSELLLSRQGLVRAASVSIKPDFTFIFNGEEFECHRIFAAFVSPAVTQILKSDPTVSCFEIKLDKYPSHMFRHVIDLMHGKTIDATECVDFLRDVGRVLGNTELQNIGKSNFETPNLLNCIEGLQSRLDCQSPDADEWIDFVAGHLSEFDPRSLMTLSASNLCEVLKSNSVVIPNEEWLLDLVESFIQSDSSYCECLGHVKMGGLKKSNLNRFMSLIDPSHLGCSTWEEISAYMSTGSAPRPARSRYIQNWESYEYDGSNKLRGIISHFKQAGTFSNIIRLTASSTGGGNINNILERDNSSWESECGLSEPYFTFELRNKTVRLTGYTIGTRADGGRRGGFGGAGGRGRFPKSWDVKVSTDGSSWTTVDSKRNCRETNVSSADYHVRVETEIWAKYVRFHMTERNYDDQWCFVLARVELFGHMEDI